MYRVIIILFGLLLLGCQPDGSEEEKTIFQEGVKELDQSFITYAKNGNTEKVLQLLQQGVAINAVDSDGTTAVLAATQNNQIETVKVLIEAGADLDVQNDHLDNVLLYAGAEGMIEIVKLAIDAGADTTITNRFGGTALIPAAERGHVDVVKELLVHSDVDVNHINNLHWTALLEAVLLGDGGTSHQEIVQLLVDHGADMTIGDREGVTPLEHAIKNDYSEIAEILKAAE
ncbi:ankyrin repeat domain-containing protein [Gracilibacillus alcaliphilus]|uniref:ankyrin repeat domain-containing protein n=1 Tax=Gracilibacillus alcaliphilus TaxID=1401441 RepID=UPI0019572125|nr:ankyrin repeat protein [Gracilibacillus alcaliphilus]